MAVRPLVLHPDARLRQVAAPVPQGAVGMDALIGDMFDTMYAAYGRGLAAPQVGVGQRVFVMDAGWKAGPKTPCAFINPVIVARSGATETLTEACLSIPEQEVTVTRPAQVQVTWTTLGGQDHSAWFSGFEAACIQHEIDHLDGVLILDHGS